MAHCDCADSKHAGTGGHGAGGAKAAWRVPEGPTPTTHNLKPATGPFDGYAENEHFCLKLAQRLGLRNGVVGGLLLLELGEGFAAH